MASAKTEQLQDRAEQAAAEALASARADLAQQTASDEKVSFVATDFTAAVRGGLERLLATADGIFSAIPAQVTRYRKDGSSYEEPGISSDRKPASRTDRARDKVVFWVSFQGTDHRIELDISEMKVVKLGAKS